MAPWGFSSPRYHSPRFSLDSTMSRCHAHSHTLTETPGIMKNRNRGCLPTSVPPVQDKTFIRRSSSFGFADMLSFKAFSFCFDFSSFASFPSVMFSFPLIALTCFSLHIEFPVCRILCVLELCQRRSFCVVESPLFLPPPWPSSCHSSHQRPGNTPVQFLPLCLQTTVCMSNSQIVYH